MKTAPTLLLLLSAALWLLGDTALAQTQTRSVTIYRCGAEGRDLRDSPCPNQPMTAASQLQFDAPSAGQSRSAAEQTAADSRRAQAMEQTRLQQEAQASRRAATATGINGLAGAQREDQATAGKQAASNTPLKAPKPPKSPKTPKVPAAAITPEVPNVPKPPASPSAPKLNKPAKPQQQPAG
jgi:hypothetical protein